MSTNASRTPVEDPGADRPNGRPEPGHDAYVRAAIAEGLEDIRAGRITPVEQVWKELGLE